MEAPHVAELDARHPLNLGPLTYLSTGAGARRPLSAAPGSVPDAYQGCGCHPDVVERLWDPLGAGLPRAARALVLGTPALVQPDVGVVLALGLGTSYALRLPPEALAEPAALALASAHRFASSGRVLDLAGWGAAWRFGAYHLLEPEWLARASADLAAVR